MSLYQVVLISNLRCNLMFCTNLCSKADYCVQPTISQELPVCCATFSHISPFSQCFLLLWLHFKWTRVIRAVCSSLSAVQNRWIKWLEVLEIHLERGWGMVIGKFPCIMVKVQYAHLNEIPVNSSLFIK